MTDDRIPTRREAIKYGSALAAGSLLAGCTVQDGSDAEPDSESEPTTDNSTDSSETETEPSTYEACLEPAGCLTFEEVPESYIVNNGEWADMAFALGQRDGFMTATNMIPGFMFDPFGLDVPPESETT